MDSYRDWGHSKDYVRAMHLIINNNKPEDFVVATGVTHSVRDMTNYITPKLELDTEQYIFQNQVFRPEELKYLKGDSTKLRENSIGNQNILLRHYSMRWLNFG